jgi:DNA-binding HxlR family transcriptional regulator
LVRAGLIDKEKLTGRYRSVRYSLTGKGAKMERLVRELDRTLV